MESQFRRRATDDDNQMDCGSFSGFSVGKADDKNTYAGHPWLADWRNALRTSRAAFDAAEPYRQRLVHGGTGCLKRCRRPDAWYGAYRRQTEEIRQGSTPSSISRRGQQANILARVAGLKQRICLKLCRNTWDLRSFRTAAFHSSLQESRAQLLRLNHLSSESYRAQSLQRL